MAKTKKSIKKPTLARKKKAPKKPATKAVSKKAVKDASTAAPEAAPVEGGKQTKTAFVLSFPQETPAKDVVSAGAAAGIKLSEKGVYKTRYLARNKAPKAAKKASTKTPAKAAKPAPKAPKKPGKRGPGDGSGSAFIRSQSTSMKASEVVAAAAAQGITITPGLVYSVRQALKKSGKAPSTPTGKRRGRPPAAAKAAAPKAVVNVAAGGDRERQLVGLAVDIGLARSVELIESMRAKIDTLY